MKKLYSVLITFFILGLSSILWLSTQNTAKTTARENETGPPASRPKNAEPLASTAMNSGITASIQDKIRADIPRESHLAMPLSLRDTEIDGEFLIDDYGDFIPNVQALNLFLYFFSASGEESDAVIGGRILRYALEKNLPETALVGIQDALNRFIAFRDAVETLAKSDEWQPEDLNYRAETLYELRREILGEELNQAFYAEEELVTKLDIEYMEAIQDPYLSEEERNFRTAYIESQLPESIQQSRKEAKAPTQLSKKVAELRRAGASDDDIFKLRQDQFGREAAQRLSALDASREAWQQRLDNYRDSRNHLTKEKYSALSEAELDALREKHFSREELLRVKLLEQAGLLGSL